MKKLMKPLLLSGLLCVSLASQAGEVEMKEALIEIIQLLEYVKPVVEQAQKEQPKDARVKVQFESYTDSDGNQHAGLKDDLNAIQQSLEAIVNQQGLEERTLSPIKSDFVE